MSTADRSDSRTTRERETLRWTKNLAIFTGLLFLATAISDVIISIDTLEKKTAQSTTEEQLRAFLAAPAITQVRGYNVNTKTFGPAFSVSIQNVGGSRTAWVDANASAKYFPDGVPSNLDLTKPYVDVGVHRSVVGPQGVLPISPVGVSDEEVDSARSGRGVILVRGTAHYATIYDPQKTLTMQFCYLMNAFTPPPLPNTANVPEAPKQSELALIPIPYRDDCNHNE